MAWKRSRVQFPLDPLRAHLPWLRLPGAREPRFRAESVPKTRPLISTVYPSRQIPVIAGETRGNGRKITKGLRCHHLHRSTGPALLRTRTLKREPGG